MGKKRDSRERETASISQGYVEVQGELWEREVGGRGHKTDSDPFRILQLPERTEWRTGVSATGDVPGQPGNRYSTSEEGDIRSIDPRVGWIQRRCDGCANPTAW